MQLKDLYQKDITRSLNPAVSADSFDDETVRVEIDEYVFTAEIIDGLYRLMSAIRNRKHHHDGIWISGYFGSGKSHFLKYLNYCFDPRFREQAMGRLLNAVENDFDTFSNTDVSLNTTISDLKDLNEWLKKATIDTVIFNISHVHNTNEEKAETFLSVFWKQFNKHRGFNDSNLALAQYLEKTLAKYGKLAEFKARILAETETPWEKEAGQLAKAELDYVLDTAKDVCDKISTDVFRDDIKDDTIELSPGKFAKELADYLATRDDNYRMVFLVDEVSQFISTHKDLLLQLQSIVEVLHTECKDKVWVACTAQQDLSEIVESFQINQASEDYGKIMGRFEVRMSLKGSSPEYITQRRVLEKNGVGERVLGELYKSKKEAVENQFVLPKPYEAFNTEQEFVNFYPFVPYQLRLIRQVFDSFVKHGFVESEVKGNERSIIKVTFKAAQLTSGKEEGFLVPFDQFFHAMFQDALLDKGLRALSNAKKIADFYTGSKAFAARVVHALFMIANIGENDKLLFKATLDNMTILLMDNVDASKNTLRNEIKGVLDFLCEEKAIHCEEDKSGDKVYMFYNEDEMEVATLISSISVDTVKMADVLREEIFKYFGVENKRRFVSRDFSVGAELWTRNYLATNNPDVKVAFVMESEDDSADAYGLTNDNNRLAFFMADAYKKDVEFRKDFYWYCQVQRYLETNLAQTEARNKTHKDFQGRAESLWETKLLPKLKNLLDTCVVVSGTMPVQKGNVPGKAKDRYKAALDFHLGRIYSEAALVDGCPTDTGSLSKKIERPFDPLAALAPMTPAMRKVETYLMNHNNNCQVVEVLRHFSRPPYGWHEICSLFVMNELVRTPRYEFEYNSMAHVDVKTVSTYLYKNKDCFKIKAADVIPQDTLNSFIDSWNKAFNDMSIGTQNEAGALFTFAKEDPVSGLPARIKALQDIKDAVAGYPFVGCLSETIEKLEAWKNERDHRKFFELVIAGSEEVKGLCAKCRELDEFVKDKLDKYKSIRRFVEANSENFTHLAGYEEKVSQLQAIRTDEWPIGANFRGYRKLMDELEPKLNEIRENEKESIRAKVDAVYASLEELVKTLQLKEPAAHYLPSKDAYISSACAKTSLAELKLARMSVDSFETEQRENLYKKLEEEQAPVVPPDPPKPGADNGTQPAGGDGSAPVVPPPQPPVAPKGPRPKVVKLNLHSGTKLRNKAELEAYLADLRVQLEAHINDDEYTVIQ